MKNLRAYLIFSLFLPSFLFAQIPTDVPHPDNNPPVDFSEPANIVIFIILPILAIVFFFIWRSKRKKESDH